MTDNQALFEKKIAILQEISGTIVATDNIGVIANLMLDLAIGYTNAQKGSLMLINERDEFYILAARGIDPQLVKTYRIRLGHGIAGKVAENRLPVLVEDIDRDERFRGVKRDHYNTRSFISCPVISKNKLLGIININDKADGTPFKEDEFALIKIISNQAAIALENAFLMNQHKAKALELEEINKKLIEIDVVKTEFLTRVSHEFRTPLNSIKGAIFYLMQSEKLGRGEQKEFFEIVSNEAGKLISIVENLLDFLRLENESALVKKSIINIPDILKEVSGAKSLRTSLTRKNLKLDIGVKGTVSDIVGDRIRVVQFFMNLLEGLIHFLSNRDSISVEVKENDYVEVNFKVSRRVPDIELKYLYNHKRIFDIDQPEERLKLYLARKVAEVHKWNLFAENIGDSCLITLTIPKSVKQKVDTAIDTSIEMFIEFVSELLDVNICSIMLSDELTGDLTIKSAMGLSEEVIKRTRLRFGDRVAGWVALEGKPLLIENIEEDPRFGRKNIDHYNTKSLISIPLKINDKVIGVLNLNNKKSAEPFTAQDLSIASTLSDRITHFIEKLHREGYMEGDFKQFLTSFDGLLNAQKRYGKKGGIRQGLILKVMDKLEDVTEDQKKTALYVSMIYDLGLMVVGESVLKKEKLLPAEARTLKAHPRTTLSLLDNFEYSRDVQEAILHHHERYDGTGYPNGLKGTKIPFISRVLTVIDAYCAMTTERPYGVTFSAEGALEEIKKDSRTIFDPRVVEALESVIKTS